jgi:hypothetical protein
METLAMPGRRKGRIMNTSRMAGVIIVASLLTAGPDRICWAGSTGGALYFDGTDDYLSVTGFSMTTQALTVEAWVSISWYPVYPAYGKIMDFGGPTPGGRFTLQSTPTGVNFSIDGGGPPPVAPDAYVEASLSLSAWHHVAGTWESSGTMHLYVDGVMVDTGTYAVSQLTIASGNSHYIGKRYASYSGADDVVDCFAGALDELRIWNVVLTPEQIAAAYNQPVAGNTQGLVSYWCFGEGAGVVTGDSTGHGWSAILGGDGSGSDLPIWVVTGAPLIPEPATLSLLALGGLAMIRRR